MTLRKVVSFTMFFSLAVMLVSSVVLFIVPQGRVAYWASWSLWGLSKATWGAIHTNAGFLMVLAGLFHVKYNWRPITSYMKNKARQVKVFTPSFNVALVVMVAFVAGTIAEIPPFIWIQNMRTAIEENGVEAYGEPPYGHAEQSSFRVFIRNVGMDQNMALEHLKEAGIEVPGIETTIEDLATAASLSPQALFEIMKGPETEVSQEARSIPVSVPRGTGRKTIDGFCTEFNLDPSRAREILQEAGILMEDGQVFMDIAEQNGLETLDLLDLLRQGFETP